MNGLNVYIRPASKWIHPMRGFATAISDATPVAAMSSNAA